MKSRCVKFGNLRDVRRKNGSKLDYFEKNWDWMKSRKDLSCEFQKLDNFDVSDFFNGSWVVVAADSQARFMVLSLLNLDLVSNSKARESINDLKVITLMLDFVWALMRKLWMMLCICSGLGFQS